MEHLQQRFFQALIGQYPQPEFQKVFTNASDQLATMLTSLPKKVGKSPEAILDEPRSLFFSMHLSWQEEVFFCCPTELHQCIRAALQKASEKRSTSENSLDQFLLLYLMKKWPERVTEGIESIEETPLRWLAQCDETTITSLMELIATYEIVDFVRSVVDKKILQKIFLGLTPLQQRYVRSLLHLPKQQSSFSKEQTSLMVNDPEVAKKQLSKKGLERMGLALKTAPDLLIWHVLHHMDRDQARLIKQNIPKTPSPKCVEASKHLMHAYQFLKKGEKP